MVRRQVQPARLAAAATACGASLLRAVRGFGRRAPQPGAFRRLRHTTTLMGKSSIFSESLREQRDELVGQIALTPFSREEFYIAISDQDETITALERARRFFVRARQARTGLAQTATLGRWANCRNTSRAGMSGVVSRWLGSVESLPQVAERLMRVQNRESSRGGRHQAVR